jgi:nicotinamide-nucleotide amidase
MAEQNQAKPNARPADGAGHLQTAVLLAVGSELIVGETRDTNSGDLARSLSAHGVDVRRIVALPDRLASVVDALRDALAEADLVVATGGLGPTPDDLTRESIAAVLGETPAVDPELEKWLRHLFERRSLAFAEPNIKQAWLIPSATAIPNQRGTAPGWWVEAAGKGAGAAPGAGVSAGPGVIVALPGPPGEMRPMWDDWVLPRLVARGLGREQVTRTYRLTGIGESVVAALLGEPMLRAENPIVATYARSDAVDVRISARAENGRSPAEIADAASAAVLAAVGDHVWGHDDDTWPAVLGRALTGPDWTVSLVEAGTGGSTTRLFGDVPWLVSSRLVAAGEAEAHIGALATRAREISGATIGLAVRTIESGEDTQVEVAASGPWGLRQTRQTAFLGGADGRRRAGIAAAAFLERILRESAAAGRAGAAAAGGTAPTGGQ